mmetsp:Transcript_58886/g.65962  ORF Transcript_58886/g.65962 Transcript_58886/m.65962 type:complete len:1032 (-) Transcript_58886:344-3439(-)
MSDTCLVALHHHQIRTIKEGRTKRSRENNTTDTASGPLIGMEIANNNNDNKDNNNNSSTINSEDENNNNIDKMEVDESAFSQQAVSSGQSSSSQSSSPQQQEEEQQQHKYTTRERSYSRNFPKQVTDDSCESEDTEKEKEKPSNERYSSERNDNYSLRHPQHHHQQLQQHGAKKLNNGKNGVNETTGNNNDNNIDSFEREQQQKQRQQQESSLIMKRSGPVTEGGNQQSSAVSDHYRSPTLPQHERIQHVEPLDISYRCTPACLRLREMLTSRLTMIAPIGRIQVIDLSRRGLGQEDAELICTTLRINPQIAVLKLGYNNFGEKGTSLIASGCAKDGRHHQNLTVLDLGFNGMGDEGCTALSLHMVVGNHTLRNLFLSGNHITQKGAVALASAILHGCSLSRLNLSANNLGTHGVNVISQSIREVEARVQQLLQRQGGIKLGYNIKPVTIEELNVDNVSMLSKGFEALSTMVMTNFNLRNISLANNDLHDNDLALLSQSLTQNKEMPLKSLVLSFNKITCAGVECLMNAIWGSPTLKEIKLDNNKMQDRGAQLCSVVLGSIRLEVLDISCNRISTVGVKAIMKSLSENDSLQRLALCGIPMDQNASKAVSYALAYNQSLQRLNIDSCSVGYSGQRHIVAGIVSNQYTRLQVLTGFPLAPIIMTLGLPQLPEEWGNDRVLSFVRFMWSHWKLTKTVEPSKEIDKAKNLSRGPAPPSMVAASAKRAFGSLSKSEESRIAFQNELQNQIDDNPIIAPNTSILVRSQSGNNLQVPIWGEEQFNKLKEVAVEAETDYVQQEESWSDSEMESLDRSSYTGSSSVSFQNATAIEFERRNRNLIWLRSHLQTLTEVGNLAFDDADLWQLHQYFFSSVYNVDDNSDIELSENNEDLVEEGKKGKHQIDSTIAPPPTPAPSESEKSNIGRTISFRTLGKAIADAAIEVKRPNKRSSEEELKLDQEPSAKRPKNSRPRIAYYPRVKERLESKPSVQILSLMRQLKYIESVMLEGKNVHTLRDQEDNDFPSTTDVEMVLLDLL